MKFLYSLIMSLASISLAIGQEVTISNGDWDNGANWSDGTRPGSLTTGTPNTFTAGIDDINVNNNITIDGNLTFEDNIVFNVNNSKKFNVKENVLVNSNSGPTFNITGSTTKQSLFSIDGDFDFSGNNNAYINLDNAILVVYGDMSMAGGANVTFNVGENSIIYVAGNFSMQQNTKLSMEGSGAFLVDGSMTTTGVDAILDGVDGNMMIGGNIDWNNANLGPEDSVLIYSDDPDSESVLTNDNRPIDYRGTTGPGSDINGNVALFAQRNPGLCSYSYYCRTNYCSILTGTDSIICVNSPLPVTWAEVSVQESLGLVTVYWSTYSESDNDYFEVYKSNDAENWTSVGVVAGAGYSKELLSYALIDTESPTEITYYRVAQVDYDGASEFSKTVVYIPGTGLASSEGLYPNPNEGSFYLDLGEDELLSVSITNSKGESVSFNYTLLDNLIKVEIDGSYSSGFYTVTMVTNNGVAQKNFVIK